MKCATCAGEYASDMLDGSRYFHVCPPITLVRVSRGGRAVDVPLPELVATDVITVQRGALQVPIPIGELLADDIRLGDSQAPRPGARNENIDRSRPSAPHPIIAEGRGATAVE